MQVASFWQQLISGHLAKVEPDFSSEWYKDLSDGTLLTWPTAVWGENTLITNAAPTKGDWRVAPMPNWGTTKSNGNWGGSTTVVFKDSKHPAQAAQFAEWLNTNQQSITGLITKGGLYPADIAGQQQPAANSPVPFYGGQNIWKVFQGLRQAGEHQLPVGPDHGHHVHPDAGRLWQDDGRIRHAFPGAELDPGADHCLDEAAGLLGQACLSPHGAGPQGRALPRKA